MKPIRFVILLFSAALAACSAERFDIVDPPRYLLAQRLLPEQPGSAATPVFREAACRGPVLPRGGLPASSGSRPTDWPGNLGRISQWLEKDRNAWLGRGDSNGWEEVPYWLRGYAATAYILGRPGDDGRGPLVDRGDPFDAAADGWFGPVLTNERGQPRPAGEHGRLLGSCRTTTTIRATSVSSRS